MREQSNRIKQATQCLCLSPEPENLTKSDISSIFKVLFEISSEDFEIIDISETRQPQDRSVGRGQGDRQSHLLSELSDSFDSKNYIILANMIPKDQLEGVLNWSGSIHGKQIRFQPRVLHSELTLSFYSEKPSQRAPRSISFSKAVNLDVDWTVSTETEETYEAIQASVIQTKNQFCLMSKIRQIDFDTLPLLTVYISNIPVGMTPVELSELLSEFGSVIYTRVISGKTQGNYQFGFVLFESSREASYAKSQKVFYVGRKKLTMKEPKRGQVNKKVFKSIKKLIKENDGEEKKGTVFRNLGDGAGAGSTDLQNQISTNRRDYRRSGEKIKSSRKSPRKYSGGFRMELDMVLESRLAKLITTSFIDDQMRGSAYGLKKHQSNQNSFRGKKFGYQDQNAQYEVVPISVALLSLGRVSNRSSPSPDRALFLMLEGGTTGTQNQRNQPPIDFHNFLSTRKDRFKLAGLGWNRPNISQKLTSRNNLNSENQNRGLEQDEDPEQQSSINRRVTAKVVLNKLNKNHNLENIKFNVDMKAIPRLVKRFC